jgi:hypothetical protein
MRFVPVVNRELNVLARRSASYWARASTAFLAFVVMAWLLALTAQTSFLGLGRSIFVILSWVAFAYALVAGIHATADCISEEKRDGTLGLLFLTDLRAYDVILGKMSAGSVSAAYALLAILPMISLGLLVGGVALQELLEAAAILANTLFFSLALGVYISTLSRNERRSVFAASVIMFLLAVFPFAFIFTAALYGYYVSFSTGLEIVGFVSPIYPLLELHLSAGPGAILTVQQRYISMAIYHGIAWMLLFAACAILPRYINDAPGKRTAKMRAAGETLVMGTRPQRQARRRKLLDRNAFLWLVSRERGKGVQAWFLVLFFAGLYLWVALNHSNLAHDLPINITILLTVHFTLKLWLASDVCNRLIQDRRDGALELLLATPLTVARIAQGQTLALRRVFFGPVLALLICEGLLAWLEYKAGRQRPAPMDRVLTYAILAGTLLANLWALKWVGLWRSLWGKGIERVLGSTLGIVLGVPLFAFGTVYILARVFAIVGGVDPPYRFFIVTFALLTFGWAIPAGWSARRKFFTYFRECAANRFGGEGAAPPRPAPPSNQPAIPFWRRPAFVGLSFVLAIIVLAGLGRRAFWTLKLRSEISEVRREGFPIEWSVWNSQGNGLHGLAAELREPTPSQGFQAWDNNGSLNAMRFIDISELEPALKVNGRELQALRQLTNYNALHLPLTNRVNLARYSALGCIEFLSASAANDRERAFQAVRGLLALIRLLQTSTRSDAQHFIQQCLNNLAMVLNGRFRFTPEQLQVLADDLNAIPEDTATTRLATARALIFEEGLVWANLSPGNLAHRIVLSFQLWSGSRAKAQWLAARSIRQAIEVVTQAQAPERFDALKNWPAELRFRPILSAEEFAEAVRFQARQTIQREAEITAWLRVLKSAVWIAQLRSLGRESENHQESVHFVDPFTGERMKTKRNRLGTLAIYSVGPDRKDDNGTIRTPSWFAGDLVIWLP